MDSSASQCRIRLCFKCEENAEFLCDSCPCVMCFRCKERHAIYIHTKYHVVMIYRERFDHIPIKETCVRHPGTVSGMYCESCKMSVCKFCKSLTKHKRHQHIDIRKAYETKRHELAKTIHTIRGETLFYRRALLAEIKYDLTKPDLKIAHCLSLKGQQMKNLIDVMMKSECIKYKSLLRSKLEKQTTEMKRNLAYIQNYEMMYEHLANRPLQYISFLKKTFPFKLYLTQPGYLSWDESFNTKDVTDELRKIQFIESKRRHIGNERLKKLIPAPVAQSSQIHAPMVHTSPQTPVHPLVLQQSFRATDVNICRHISCVTSSRAWVSDDSHNLVLINTRGKILARFNLCDGYGVHTLCTKNELIYLDKKYNIKQLSTNMWNVTTIASANRTDSKWTPRCIYYSPSKGDLLVGMHGNDEWTDYESQYYKLGQTTIAIRYVNKWLKKLSEPTFITENKNGDVVVCDNLISAVVVATSGGTHRFTYTGHSEFQKFKPFGICTDELAHIIVCSGIDSAEIIDESGQFISYLHFEKLFWLSALRLSYDKNTQCLWIGSSKNNRVRVYEYKALEFASRGNSKTFIHTFDIFINYQLIC